MFDGAVHRTGLTTSAAELMCRINKELGNKKSRATTNIRHMHGSVLGAKIDKLQFQEDLKKICRISIDSLEVSENDEVH